MSSIAIVRRCALGGAARDVRGGAAVEFALLAPVFLLALLGLAEIGLVAYRQIQLENAVHEVTKLVRLSDDDLGAVKVRETFCGALDADACSRGGVTLLVSPARDIASTLERSAAAANNRIELGSIGDYVIVVASYDWRPVIPFFWRSLSIGDGPPRLVATHIGRKQETVAR